MGPKKKVKDKARTKKKMAESEKKLQASNEELFDALEVLSHNCIKLCLELSWVRSVIDSALEEQEMMEECHRKVDIFIMKSEAEIEEMRHLIMKK